MILRPYQNQSVNAVINYLKKNPDRNPVVASAGGTGKSVMIASLIKRISDANPDVKIMCACHVAKLLKQNAEKLKILKPEADIGFYSDGLGHKELNHKFIFAGIQSIFRIKEIGHFNILIVDEVHSISRKESSMWQTLIDKMRTINPRLIIVGYSATTWREDSGSLVEGKEAMFDDIVFDYNLAQAIQDGYLCGLTSKYTTTEYDISGVGKLGGEFNLTQLEAATNINHLTKKAVAEIIDKAKDKKAWLVFCNGVAHSFAIRDEFIRMGIPCETVTGETSETERDRILEDLRTGKIRAVTNNGVWTTGVDIPELDCIIMLRHTMSSSLLVQMAVRGTRLMVDVSSFETAKERREAILNSSKPHCLFLDFARNIDRHGFLDQIKGRHKKEKGEGVAPMKACPECYSILHISAMKCKDCGFEFEKPDVKTAVGELYKGAVLTQKEEKVVTDVFYSPHNLNKEGKIPCLRVQYLHPDDSATNEYVCLQHEGFAKTKAEKWWKDRTEMYLGGGEIEKLFKYKMLDNLKIPKAIVISKDGKYDRISEYQELHFPVAKEANAPFEDLEIDW